MKPITFLAALIAALQLLSSPAVASGDWTWPIRGEVITQYRNGSDPYAAGQHRGIDIAGKVGDPVVAATRGTVTFAGVAGSSGLTISIRTADGRFDTSYLHLSSAAVRAGQSVAAGQRVGAVGVSGRRSAEQPHLHFGVREAGQRQAYRDPLDFLAPPPAPPRPEPAPPRGAPAPVGDRAPIPLPAALVASAPAAAPAATHAAPPRALGSSLPAPRASRVPAHAPHAAPRDTHAASLGSAPARHPTGVTASAPSSPRRAMHPTHAVRPSPARAPDVRLDGSPRDRVAAAPRSAPRQPARHTASSHGGFDVGWFAACVGLVAAACALGRPDGAKAAALRGRDAFAALLEPLHGRR